MDEDQARRTLSKCLLLFCNVLRVGLKTSSLILTILTHFICLTSLSDWAGSSRPLYHRVKCGELVFLQ